MYFFQPSGSVAGSGAPLVFFFAARPARAASRAYFRRAIPSTASMRSRHSSMSLRFSTIVASILRCRWRLDALARAIHEKIKDATDVNIAASARTCRVGPKTTFYDPENAHFSAEMLLKSMCTTLWITFSDERQPSRPRSSLYLKSRRESLLYVLPVHFVIRHRKKRPPNGGQFGREAREKLHVKFFVNDRGIDSLAEANCCMISQEHRRTRGEKERRIEILRPRELLTDNIQCRNESRI